MQKYILVQWPDSQMLMDHPRFNECLFVDDMDGHDSVGSSAYMCPEDLHDEIFFGSSKADHYANKLSALREGVTEAIYAAFDESAEIHVEQTLDDGEQLLSLKTKRLGHEMYGDILVKCEVYGHNGDRLDDEDYDLDTFSLDNLIEILRQLCSHR